MHGAQQQQQQLPVIAVMYFTAIWTAINLAFWAHRRFTKPAITTERTRSITENQEEDEPVVEAELVSPLHLRITTSALKRPVAWVAQSSWFSQSTVRGMRLIDIFYAIGIYCTVILMLLCLAVLCTAGMQIAQQLNGKIGNMKAWAVNPASDLQATQHSKRQEEQLLRPVIPGITLPSAHLAHYVLSLAMCALVHELGHAVAASASAIRIRKFGVFVMGVYPGAFVDLQRDQLDRSSVGDRLRVACAGVWHNALTALVAWLLVYGGLLRSVFLLVGWLPVTDGVAVVDVAKGSPLFGTLPLGSHVCQIDDVFLAPLDGELNQTADVFGSLPLQRWTNVLTATKSNRETVTKGYCALVEDENVDDGLCCEMSASFPLGLSPDSQIFCFERYDGESDSMCLLLSDVLQRTGSMRCTRNADCPPTKGFRCVLPRSPYAEGRVARVYYRDAEHVQMAIYAGSLESLWLDVQVSTLRAPRLFLSCLPAWCETLAQYTLSFSVAFALLNAIPAWYLDGDHVLRFILLAFQASMGWQRKQNNEQEPSDSSDSEDDVVRSSSSRALVASETDLELAGTLRWIHTVTTALATALLAWCVVGSVVLLVL
ncbi:hypothetical protein IW138_002874 [Coemansia sp. RSA 986]|nr:hypothetical protein IW138_002874 [Coemansia sp. RSA 986]